MKIIFIYITIFFYIRKHLYTILKLEVIFKYFLFNFNISINKIYLNLCVTIIINTIHTMQYVK